MSEPTTSRLLVAFYMVAVASPAMMNDEKVDTVDNKWTVDVAEFNFAQNLTKRYAIDVTASQGTPLMTSYPELGQNLANFCPLYVPVDPK